MTCIASAAGGRKVQPQKPHLLCQQPAVSRPGGNWMLVTAITSHRPCFAQGEFTICSIIMFGCATSPPCHRCCSSTGRQGWLSGWHGTEEKGNSWSLQKAVGNRVGSGVGGGGGQQTRCACRHSLLSFSTETAPPAANSGWKLATLKSTYKNKLDSCGEKHISLWMHHYENSLTC